MTFGAATFGPVNNYECKDMSELPSEEHLRQSEEYKLIQQWQLRGKIIGRIYQDRNNIGQTIFTH